MRKAVLILNGIVVIFFSCFIGYTFVAQKHLESLARGFVTEKTLEYSKPVVDGVEEVLLSSKAAQLLSKEHKALIQGEIDNYREDPVAYISDLTGQQSEKEPMIIKNPLLLKVVDYKAKIRAFYQDTLDALILDLRIMSTCNLLAGITAFFMAWRSPRKVRKTLVGLSMIIFLGVIYCTYLYVDDLNFFTILFRLHLGWLYGLLLVLTIYDFYRRYGDGITRQVKQEDGRQAAKPE